MLGELQPALELASDSSAAVRATLAQRLGYYREAEGIEVLKRLFADSNPEVAKEAKTALRLLNQIDVPPTIDQLARSTPWGKLLAEISCAQLADRDLAVTMPDHKLSSGWLGENGATEEEIASAEHRLGVRLPPSYRAFLAESNGFDDIGPFIYRLYNAAEIEWFRVRDPQWVEIWQNDDYPDASREEHLADPLNCVVFRRAYLSSCLQISDVGDSAVVLLNPEVVNGEGEWETWFFSNWGPGAERYPSFRAYVESELESIKRMK
jgi:cell wall assembly regulator SMI1